MVKNFSLNKHRNPPKIQFIFTLTLFALIKTLKIPALSHKIHALLRLAAAPWLIIFKKTLFLTRKNCFFEVKKLFFSD